MKQEEQLDYKKIKCDIASGMVSRAVSESRKRNQPLYLYVEALKKAYKDLTKKAKKEFIKL